jgi:hypothetical protein
MRGGVSVEATRDWVNVSVSVCERVLCEDDARSARAGQNTLGACESSDASGWVNVNIWYVRDSPLD